MKKIKIIQSSDVHSYMFSSNYVETVNQGLLSHKKYIENLRKDNDVLLIDTGDMLQGSPLSYYINKFDKQELTNPLTDVLNDMKYDVFTLGNHEFNYGLEYIKKSLHNFNGEVVIANIDGIENVINTKPYVIKEISGLKIAIIGFVTKYVPNWEQSENINGLKFNSVIETYEKYEEELKQNADIIIVNYHGGFECSLEDINEATEKLTQENEGSELLKKFDSIDILLTGHQHREIAQKINGTICMQPSVNAKKISEITINLDGTIEDYKLVESKELVFETAIESLTKLERSLQNYLDKEIGTVNEPMKIEDVFDARLNSHALVNFINDMQLEVTGADVSAVSIFDSAIGFDKMITIRDIIINYPFPNTLKVLKITSEDLKGILEVAASYFTINPDGEVVPSDRFSKPKPQHFNYDMFGGLKYKVDISRPIGDRVVEMNIDKKELLIVVNNYRSTSYAWYPQYEGKEVIKEITIDMVELLINYITEKENIIVRNERDFEVYYSSH